MGFSDFPVFGDSLDSQQLQDLLRRQQIRAVPPLELSPDVDGGVLRLSETKRMGAFVRSSGILPPACPTCLTLVTVHPVVLDAGDADAEPEIKPQLKVKCCDPISMYFPFLDTHTINCLRLFECDYEESGDPNLGLDNKQVCDQLLGTCVDGVCTYEKDLVFIGFYNDEESRWESHFQCKPETIHVFINNTILEATCEVTGTGAPDDEFVTTVTPGTGSGIHLEIDAGTCEIVSTVPSESVDLISFCDQSFSRFAPGSGPTSGCPKVHQASRDVCSGKWFMNCVGDSTAGGEPTLLDCVACAGGKMAEALCLTIDWAQISVNLASADVIANANLKTALDSWLAFAIANSVTTMLPRDDGFGGQEGCIRDTQWKLDGGFPDPPWLYANGMAMDGPTIIDAIPTGFQANGEFAPLATAMDFVVEWDESNLTGWDCVSEVTLPFSDITMNVGGGGSDFWTFPVATAPAAHPLDLIITPVATP